MLELKPPCKLNLEIPVKTKPIIFLAGSIEMGAAERWQDKTASLFKDTDFIILNPYRNYFDPSWKQTIDNSYFKEQVEWELDGLELADAIIMYFDPNTKSPISLLELGLMASSGKLVAVCPNGFWRKGNVDIVCKRYNIRQFDCIEDAVNLIRKSFIERK